MRVGFVLMKGYFCAYVLDLISSEFFCSVETVNNTSLLTCQLILLNSTRESKL